jgi:cyclopropane fatty-acyl-phospholipid synthase-like methyltransferase
MTMTNEQLTARLAKPRFPRSSRYDGRWIVDNLMGPHVLWLAEYLSEALELKPGMRVLDLGCGKAISSIFLAKEFGVQVIAADLWIKPTQNARRIEAAGVAASVTPVHAEAHALPFAEESFDAIVSLDAYQYFGTDDLYLGTIAKFLKTGGRLGIVCPGLAHEIETIPENIRPFWEWDFCCFHSPA